MAFNSIIQIRGLRISVTEDHSVFAFNSIIQILLEELEKKGFSPYLSILLYRFVRVETASTVPVGLLSILLYRFTTLSSCQPPNARLSFQFYYIDSTNAPSADAYRQRQSFNSIIQIHLGLVRRDDSGAVHFQFYYIDSQPLSSLTTTPYGPFNSIIQIHRR